MEVRKVDPWQVVAYRRQRITPTAFKKKPIIAAIPYAIFASRWYFRRVAYICPQCHEIFKPTFKEAFWANHTPATRKLTCPSCGHHGFCVEVAQSTDAANNAANSTANNAANSKAY